VNGQGLPGPGLRSWSAPVRSANTGRNLLADATRLQRWATARDELWRLIEPLIDTSARVAVIGAGNGHDLPLGRLAAQGAEVTLIDIDRVALRRAGRRLSTPLRRKTHVVEHDVTAGAADQVIRDVVRGRVPEAVVVPEAPLPGAPYDLVIGDLFYSQLLYPAMLDLAVPDRRRRSVCDRYGPVLTRAVVARMHASAPSGRVVHLHDPLGWWPGHAQPIALANILETAEQDSGRAMRLIAQGGGPRDTDPRAALAHFNIPVFATALWDWPFDEHTNYLVCATLAGTPLTPDCIRPAGDAY
jgi:hypothetical protein